MRAAPQIKTAQEVKRHSGDVGTLIRAGSKLRRKLNAMLPADRARLFMAIEAERFTLNISRARLAVEAGVNHAWLGNVVRARGANVSPRMIVALLRALKTLRATERRPPHPGLVTAAYGACLAAACHTFAGDLGATRAQLKRPGSPTEDPDWMAAAQMRRIALYLASTELGIRGSELAAATRLTGAAVSIALNRIESERDDDAFDAACDRAAEMVRGK
jgi:hypothetical protein